MVLTLQCHLPMLLFLGGCANLADFTDADHDGYPFTQDCDDSDPDIHPGADEVLNGLDDDCDGLPDNCVADYDEDCDDYVRQDRGGEDCDDSDPSINPSSPETCGDGLDNDCDGGAGSCELVGDIPLEDNPDFAMAMVIGSSEGDQASYAIRAFARTDTALSDLLVGAPGNDDSGMTDSGAAFLLPGPLNTSRSTSDASLVILGQEEQAHLGMAVEAWRNEDRSDDQAYLLLAAPHAGSDSAGEVFLIFAEDSWFQANTEQVELTASAASLQQAGVDFSVLHGEEPGDAAGSALLVEELSGDSYKDMALAAPEASSGDGAVYLVTGRESYEDYIDLSSSSITHLRGSLGEGAGVSLASAGDMNADGVNDLLVGAPFRDRLAGAAYIIHGPPEVELLLSQADAQIPGTQIAGEFGSSLAGAGDADGDGYADLLVGAPGVLDMDQQSGAVYLFLGPMSGDLGLDAAQTVFYGESDGDNAGCSVAAQDLDLDGEIDVLIGASRSGVAAEEAGAAYLLRGPMPLGAVKLSTADTRFLGQLSNNAAGSVVSFVGHLNGSPYPDLLVSVPRYDRTNEQGALLAADEGAAFIYFGQRL